MQLACGLSLSSSAIEVRAVGTAAMITLTFDDANFYRVRAENNEAMVSPMDVAGLLQVRVRPAMGAAERRGADSSSSCAPCLSTAS